MNELNPNQKIIPHDGGQAIVVPKPKVEDTGIKGRISTLGSTVLAPKVNYQESVQQLSNKMAAEESEAWKKACEVFWVPGMLVYAVTTFVSSLFGKENNPNKLILNALDKTDSQIKDKTSEIRQFVRSDIIKYCKDHKITPAQLMAMENGLKEKSSFNRTDAIREIDDILGKNYSGFGENMVDSLLAYVKLENETDINKIEAHYEKIRKEKEFSWHEGTIKSSIQTIRSLNERREVLQKIKEEHIDPETHVMQTKETIRALKQGLATQERELNNIVKSVKEIDQSKLKLGEAVYQARLGVFLTKHGLDDTARKDLEKHLKPVFIDLIRGKKNIDFEKDILIELPQLKDIRGPVKLDNISSSDFERDVVERLTTLKKDLNGIYKEYFQLLKEADIENIDSQPGLQNYLAINNVQSVGEPWQAEITANSSSISQALSNREKLEEQYDSIQSKITKDKTTLNTLSVKMNDIDQTKSEIKNEYGTLETLKLKNPEIIKQFERDKVRLEKNLKTLQTSIQGEITRIYKNAEKQHVDNDYRKKYLEALNHLHEDNSLVFNGDINKYIETDGALIEQSLEEFSQIMTKYTAFDKRTPDEKNKLGDLNQKIKGRIKRFEIDVKESEKKIKESSDRLIELEKTLRDREQELGKLLEE